MRPLIACCAEALALVVLPGLELASPARGSEAARVAIFREEGFPAAGAASSPEAIERALRAAGHETRLSSAADLAEAAVLEPKAFDVVVLPYGRSFPAAARKNFTAYLRGGGDFISTGGYAFQDLLVEEGGRWIPEAEVARRRLAEALASGKSLLLDGGFESEETAGSPVGGEALDGRWRRTSNACQRVGEEPAEGKACARVVTGTAEESCEWYASLPAEAGRTYRVSAACRTEGLQGPGYAYAAVYQHGPGGGLVEFKDYIQARGTSPWTRRSYDVHLAPGATWIRVKCGLFRAAGTAWFDDLRLVEITEVLPKPMNTATGRPEDGLEVGPDQIGVFDADFRLERVARVESAAGQTIFPQGISLVAAAGWAASCVRGQDRSRWISLLDACDRYGRPRGSAGSLLINYSGRFDGSAWACFGVENTDLFDSSRPMALAALARLAGFMARGLYLRNLGSNLASYRDGETAEITAVVENRGREPAEVAVELGIDGRAIQLLQASVPAGGKASLMGRFPVLPDLPGPLVRFTAALRLRGEVIDQMESGFVLLRPQPSEGRAPLTFRDNYIRYGDRPIFLFGSDNYSNVYTAAGQGPLWWHREHEASRDFGFQIYENLQYAGPGHRLSEVDWRRFQGMARLADHHGLTFMPGILIGQNVAVSDDEIREESRLCAEYAERFKDLPRLIWYINGDYQLRHDDPALLGRKWNEFLRARYGGGEKGAERGASGEPCGIERAWEPGEVSGEIGALPFPPPGSGNWGSVSQLDLSRFHLKLVEDWNAAHVAAIRSRDVAHPITSEYYFQPFGGIDLRLTIDGQDLSNFCHFDEPVKDIDSLPLRIRWNDLRARGKSVGLGEYGVKTHPAWSRSSGASGYHIQRTKEEAKQLFLAVAHHAFGMGCSRVQNWCLRDADERVFPWGVFYPGPLVPKDVAFVHRNLSLFFRWFEPVDVPHPLTVLLCDNLRLGSHADLGLESAYRSFRALLGLRADFNVLDDGSAADIPEATRAIIYPSALAVGDEAFEALVSWVRSGGKLLLTGGPVHDDDRKPVRAERLRELAGLEWVGSRYAPADRAGQSGSPLSAGAPEGLSMAAAPFAEVRPAGARVLAALESGTPLLTRHDLGQGNVYFFADPIELGPADDSVRRLYAWFLKEAGIPRPSVEPDDPQVRWFTQATRGGRVHVAFNARDAGSSLDVKAATDAGQITLRVKDRHPALAAVKPGAAVTALGAYRAARVGQDEVLSGDGLFLLLALDGADLRDSSAILLFPLSEGVFRLRSRRDWKRPVALLGDIEGGKFRAFETLEAAEIAPAREEALDGGWTPLSATFDADRATLLCVFCEAGEASRWKDLLDTLVSSPERIRGN